MGKNNDILSDSNRRYFALSMLIIGVAMLVFYLFYKFIVYKNTKFRKVIIVQDKSYTKHRRRSRGFKGTSYNYMVVDTYGNIYILDNLWFKFKLASEKKKYDYLKKGLKYNVKGYVFDGKTIIYDVDEI